MNDFVASNGRRISPAAGSGIWLNESVIRISEEDAQALREFFRAEEDARLSRWRFPLDPDYVVYSIPDRIGVRVLRESTGTTGVYYPGESGRNTTEGMGVAAVAYFTAHPEPKPAWHDAKPGEVWVLNISDRSGETVAFARGNHVRFWEASDGENEPMTWGFRSAAITGGRRIYPELAS